MTDDVLVRDAGNRRVFAEGCDN